MFQLLSCHNLGRFTVPLSLAPMLVGIARPHVGIYYRSSEEPEIWIRHTGMAEGWSSEIPSHEIAIMSYLLAAPVSRLWSGFNLQVQRHMKG